MIFSLYIAQEIVKAVTDCKELHVLILSGNTMGVEAAKLIGDALSNHKEFQVSNCIPIDLCIKYLNAYGIK